MKHINIYVLEALGACNEQKKLFLKYFGYKDVPITLKNLLKAHHLGFDVLWLFDHIDTFLYEWVYSDESIRGHNRYTDLISERKSGKISPDSFLALYNDNQKRLMIDKIKMASKYIRYL